MSTLHHYCKYNDLGSMIIDLNASIRRLNSYLSESLEEIKLHDKNSELKELQGKLENTEQLILSNKITVCRKSVKNIKAARRFSVIIKECKQIVDAWQKCWDLCQDVIFTIESRIAAFNALNNKEVLNSDNSNINIQQIILICGSTMSSLEPMIDFEIVKDIYDKTIKEQYQLTSKCKLICKCMLCVLSIVIIGVFICGFFCSCSNNNSGKNISVIISERNTADTIQTSSCEMIDKKINGLDSLSISKTGNDMDIQLLLLKDSFFVLDTTFILKSEYKYKISDSLTNRIIIIPTERCEATNDCSMKDGNLWSHIFRLMIIIILAAVLIMILLMLRRQWEKEYEMEQKILNENLKVQNEWQDILQSRYRLAIRRQELDMNIEEKERKTQIDEDFNSCEHERKMQTEEQKNNRELMGKALEVFQSINSQRSN